MAGSSFPIVSFAPFIHGTDVEKCAVAQELYNAFHTYGWVYLRDFGISDEEVDKMFEMVWSLSLPWRVAHSTKDPHSQRSISVVLSETR